MLRWIVHGGLAVTCLVLGAGAARAGTGFLTCESIGYRYAYCAASTQGRVAMVREVSTGDLCEQGTGWGYDDDGIWVDRGCRAEFRFGRDDDGGSWRRAGRLTCESNGYRYAYCAANTQGRVLLLREVSTGNLCRQGLGWGYDDDGIWVDRGCRAEFSFGRDDGGGWGRSGRVTCASQGYRYSYCNADTQGRVRLVREVSTGNLCRQGWGWGYDGGGIWVDHGCRGEFDYGRDSGGRNDAAIAAGIVGALAIGAAISATQNTPQPVAPPPPPVATPVPVPPAWAVGSYQAYDPDSGDIVQLVVGNVGRVMLRNETGITVAEGDLRDGMVFWGNGKRSWLAREGPGVMVGDVDTGRHYYFRRNQ